MNSFIRRLRFLLLANNRKIRVVVVVGIVGIVVVVVKPSKKKIRLKEFSSSKEKRERGQKKNEI